MQEGSRVRAHVNLAVLKKALGSSAIKRQGLYLLLKNLYEIAEEAEKSGKPKVFEGTVWSPLEGIRSFWVFRFKEPPVSGLSQVALSQMKIDKIFST